MNARAEIMTSYVAQQLDGLKVRDLTWFGIAQAGTDMDADSMIWQRQRLGDAGAVAVDGPTVTSTVSSWRISCGRSRPSVGRS